MDDSNSNQAQKANLARIRDNQRRSRARRKEYLQELETKFRTCEAIGVEASAEIQAAARRVLDENKRLRQLLKLQGLTDAEIDGFNPTSSSASSSGRTDGGETPQSAPPSAALASLLSMRRDCKPGACGPKSSGCGSSSSSKGESSATPRRESCNPSVPSQPSQCTPRPPVLLPRQPAQQHLQINTRPTPTPHRSPQGTSCSSVSTAPSNEQLSVTTPQFPSPDYGVYDPQLHQAFMYNLPMENMSQWGVSNSDTMHQPLVSQQQARHVPVPYTASYAPGLDTSSCYVAADAIRSYSHNPGADVEQALGCQDGTECHVNNNVVFDLMDHYSGNPGPNRMA